VRETHSGVHTRDTRARRVLAAVALAAGLVAAQLGAEPGAPEATPRPKYGPQAVRLQDDPRYVREHAAPDFWSLLPYYLPQATESACSTASVAMLLNGLRARLGLSADEKLITHAGLLERTGDATWSAAVREGGDGLALAALAKRIEQSLAAYGLQHLEVQVVHTDDAQPATLARLRTALAANETSSSDFIVANFLQSELTGDPDGAVGHYAPLAAYDRARRRVLVLDPDRTWYEPYWVSDEVLLRGMATRDSAPGDRARGYLWIRPRPDPAR